MEKELINSLGKTISSIERGPEVITIHFTDSTNIVISICGEETIYLEVWSYES